MRYNINNESSCSRYSADDPHLILANEYYCRRRSAENNRNTLQQPALDMTIIYHHTLISRTVSRFNKNILKYVVFPEANYI